MLEFHTTDRPAPLHLHEGLTRYLRQTPVTPDPLNDIDYAALGDRARARYDRARIVYLSGGIFLNTPDVVAAKKLVTQCFAENSGRNSGHVGMMIDGESTLGKTTLCKGLMRYVYAQWTKYVDPLIEDLNPIPVVYVEVPAGATAKSLMATFAEFFGMNVRSGESMVSIRSRVVQMLNASGTQLVVVDELHNLADRTVGNGETVDLLKTLHNDVPATFVYAGIDLTTDGSLLNGPRGRQLSGRFTRLPLTRINVATDDGKARWLSIIRGFEKSLPLRHHEVGSLTELAPYLYSRTGGSIGSLARLITGAAIETITDPDITIERVDVDLLETRTLDIAAETFRDANPCHVATRTSRPRAAATRPVGVRA